MHTWTRNKGKMKHILLWRVHFDSQSDGALIWRYLSINLDIPFTARLVQHSDSSVSGWLILTPSSTDFILTDSGAASRLWSPWQQLPVMRDSLTAWTDTLTLFFNTSSLTGVEDDKGAPGTDPIHSRWDWPSSTDLRSDGGGHSFLTTRRSAMRGDGNTAVSCLHCSSHQYFSVVLLVVCNSRDNWSIYIYIYIKSTLYLYMHTLE